MPPGTTGELSSSQVLFSFVRTNYKLEYSVCADLLVYYGVPPSRSLKVANSIGPSAKLFEALCGNIVAMNHG